MKSVKNTGTTVLDIGFNGLDYVFKPGEVVAVEDEVGDFIKERCPFFEVERLSAGKEGDKVPKAEKKESKVFLNTQKKDDMVVTRTAVDDTMPLEDLPKGMDKDGVEWVGEGLERDTLN